MELNELDLNEITTTNLANLDQLAFGEVTTAVAAGPGGQYCLIGTHDTETTDTVEANDPVRGRVRKSERGYIWADGDTAWPVTLFAHNHTNGSVYVQMLPDVDALELGDDTDDGQIGSDGPSNEDYAAMHSLNTDNIKATPDKGTISFVQSGYAVLVGGGHDPALQQWVQANQTGNGTITVKKGGVLDKGKLTVTGSNEAGEMQWALEQISDKTIVFE
jgi:hypothetical protein